MSRTPVFVAVLLAVAAAGLGLRVPRLTHRPMHSDEAIHAYKCDELWRTGHYVYDPQEYHGPTLYYSTLPVLWWSGARTFAETTEATFRIVPVVCGVGLVLLLLLVADGLGRPAAACAAVLSAVSPAMVYYSGYYIQETLLVAFTFVALASGWRFVQTRHAAWALLAGAALGLMHATKETSVIAFGALGAAALVVSVWNRRIDRVAPPPQGPWRAWPVPAGALVAVFVSMLLFSCFLTNLRGPGDSLRAMTTYFDRATTGAHIHPWYYYVQILAFTHHSPAPLWSELLILILALIGAGTACTGCGRSAPQRSFARFVLVYTTSLILIYSVIPYKTPWSMLSFLHGLILLAGLGAATLLQRGRRRAGRVVVAVVLAAGALHLGAEAWRATGPYAADQRNPYVYAHPVPDVVNLGTWAERLARVPPASRDLVVKVIAPDPWPLPWYLRRLPRVGYWEAPPADPDAALVITTPDFLPEIQAKFTHTYVTSLYGLRPNEPLVVCVAEDLYRAFVATTTAPSVSGPTP